MLEWVQVGRKIVCIKDFYRCKTTDYILPQLNKVYTIRKIIPYSDGEHILYIHLDEINNSKKYISYFNGIMVDEVGFSIIHFKPLIKTDISIFTNMLKTKDKDKEYV